MTFTDPVIVTYPCTEQDADRKARIAAGLPTPTYSFTVSRYVPDDDKQEDAK